MHKKSIEASQKMKDEGDDEPIPSDCKHKDELRSESIAALRAKAQEHSARMLSALNKDSGETDKPNTDDANSNSSFDSSFFSDAGDVPMEIVRQ